MAYFSRIDLETYRRDNMSVMQATEFFSLRKLDPTAYTFENFSLAGELDGKVERDFHELELRLAGMAKDNHYEFVTNMTPSHGPRSASIAACGFKKKIGAR